MERTIGGNLMMQDNARKITYGAMMIAIFIIMVAIAAYVPLLGTIIMLFIPLPIILYRLRYDRAASIFVTIAGIILSLIGGLFLLPIAFVFGALGFVIGETIRSQKSKLYIFMAAGLTFLIATIILYLVSVILFGINMIDELGKAIQESQDQAITFLQGIGDVPEEIVKQMNETIQYTLMAIPSAFILSSFAFALIVILINLPIVKRLGHEVPKFPPFRLMKLPVLTVWVYMIVVLLPIFMTIEQGSTSEMTFVNASFILRFLFLIQGISFIHHLMNERKLSKWVTVLSTIIAILFSPLTVILGILDTGINIRAWVGKNKSR
ncbi:DUF2232 domain-containing protein [Sporosarcina pasteurii]|nr:DUF2232 domain-containing protein [Sporosarcina pasteurii]